MIQYKKNRRMIQYKKNRQEKRRSVGQRRKDTFRTSARPQRMGLT